MLQLKNQFAILIKRVKTKKLTGKFEIFILQSVLLNV